MSLRIGIDLDGVVANFISGFEESAHHKLGPETDGHTDPDQAMVDQLTTSEMKRVWNAIQETPNWWTYLAPYEPEQLKRLYSLARRHKWEVFFLTRRPQTAGETVQFQTQWWLEREGFPLPSVVTVPGSRGELANALRLDLVIDDQLLNCIEIISASKTRVILIHRGFPDETPDLTANRGIGVADNLEQAIDVAVRLDGVANGKQGMVRRWTDWLQPRKRDKPLPFDLSTRELPPLDPSGSE